VTLSAAGTGVRVGVVTDVASADAAVIAPEESTEISTAVVGTEQQTWVEVRWTPSAS
jgi:hypothetical protein